MTLGRRRCIRLAAATIALAALPRAARADTYPTRPVHILVGLAAGGPTDVAARILADWLSQRFGQQFIVENRTGMGGNLAAQALATSAADGHTLMFTGPNVTISASLYKKLPYDLLRDTVSVGAMMRIPDIMVITPSLPVHSVAELIAYAKANPGKLSFASSGVGASPHLAGELFKSSTGVNMLHVPYRGSSAVYPDLVSGRVQVFFDNLSGTVLGMIHEGKLRALGVTSAKRWPTLPDLPALAETVPGYEVIVWYGIFAPKATPPAVIDALNKGINAALADPDIRKRMADIGGEPMPMTPAELDAFVRADIAKWRKVIEFAKISAD
ncbi:MAG TPA: tripartite tricarboxylate transporter substrate binding protein [Xanthobacteraceae bacterium]|nr:tripartite tricarboxylate transporter substrate binding protein [Xanthobacteraceae bacterium]